MDSTDALRQNMATQPTTRRIRRTFTLSREAIAFISETRDRRGMASDSEALDLLLREAILEAKQREIDAAYKEYYDSASDEVLAEQGEWAELTAPNMFIGIPEF